MPTALGRMGFPFGTGSAGHGRPCLRTAAWLGLLGGAAAVTGEVEDAKRRKQEGGET
jgi:hypothetical protein